jgi:hypothetical protein
MHGCVRQPSDGDRAFRCSLYHGELYVPRCRVASTIPGNVHSRTPCRQVLYPGAAVTARACPAPAGIASSTASSALESCRLAPVPTSASRMPLAVYRDMPLAAELVPVGRVRPCLFAPRGWLRSRQRCSHGSSQPHRIRAVAQTTPDAGAPTRRHSTSREANASMSCHYRSPFPAASPPMGCQCAARTECHSIPTGHLFEDVCLLASMAAQAATAQGSSTIRH